MEQFPPIPGVRVIGVGHKARNGKDTLAKCLIAERPFDCWRFAFADALKVVARVRHGMTIKDAPLLQRTGVEARARDLDVWIRALYWTLDEVRPAIAVITDVRFENEAAFVKGLGGALVRVRRVLPDGSFYVDPSRDPNHISETALDGFDGWDATIDAASVEELRPAALALLG